MTLFNTILIYNRVLISYTFAITRNYLLKGLVLQKSLFERQICNNLFVKYILVNILFN